VVLIRVVLPGQARPIPFNTTDVPLEFGLLTAEIGEAFTGRRKRLPRLRRRIRR
jgi:hypothetical protein